MTTNNTKLPALPKLPKLSANNTCACGCGGRTGSRFVPGHDSKLKGMRIRVERGLWVETPEGQPVDVTAQLDALAATFGPSFAAATAAEMKVEWKPEAARKTA